MSRVSKSSAPMNLDSLKNVELRKFCGIPVEERGGVTYICPNEAVGEISVEIDDGEIIPFPVCAEHIEQISRDYQVSI